MATLDQLRANAARRLTGSGIPIELLPGEDDPTYVDANELSWARPFPESPGMEAGMDPILEAARRIKGEMSIGRPDDVKGVLGPLAPRLAIDTAASGPIPDRPESEEPQGAFERAALGLLGDNRFVPTQGDMKLARPWMDKPGKRTSAEEVELRRMRAENEALKAGDNRLRGAVPNQAGTPVQQIDEPLSLERALETALNDKSRAGEPIGDVARFDRSQEASPDVLQAKADAAMANLNRRKWESIGDIAPGDEDALEMVWGSVPSSEGSGVKWSGGRSEGQKAAFDRQKVAREKARGLIQKRAIAKRDFPGLPPGVARMLAAPPGPGGFNFDQIALKYGPQMAAQILSSTNELEGRKLHANAIVEAAKVGSPPNDPAIIRGGRRAKAKEAFPGMNDLAYDWMLDLDDARATGATAPVPSGVDALIDWALAATDNDPDKALNLFNRPYAVPKDHRDTEAGYGGWRADMLAEISRLLYERAAANRGSPSTGTPVAPKPPSAVENVNRAARRLGAGTFGFTSNRP